jgi:hypothetical protein
MRVFWLILLAAVGTAVLVDLGPIRSACAAVGLLFGSLCFFLVGLFVSLRRPQIGCAGSAALSLAPGILGAVKVISVVLRDPAGTSHNLWPLEIVVMALCALIPASVGWLAGYMYRKLTAAYVVKE